MVIEIASIIEYNNGDIGLNTLNNVVLADELEILKYYYMANLEYLVEDLIMETITEARDSIEDCIARGNNQNGSVFVESETQIRS